MGADVKISSLLVAFLIEGDSLTVAEVILVILARKE